MAPATVSTHESSVLSCGCRVLVWSCRQFVLVGWIFFAFWKFVPLPPFLYLLFLDFSGLSYNLNKETMLTLSLDWLQWVPVFPCWICPQNNWNKLQMSVPGISLQNRVRKASAMVLRHNITLMFDM